MSLQKLPKTMKHIAVSALSLLTIQSFAQTGFDFGVKGEFQSSSLINLKDEAAGNELNFKDRAALAAGVGAGYSFTKHIGAEIDILYSGEGTQYTGNTTLIPAVDKGVMCNELQRIAQLNNIPFSGNYTADAYLNYIKIPILFRYNMKNTKRVFFSMFIGPQFDILSSAAIKINGHTASSVAANLKASDVYKKSETDGVLGLGLGVNLTKNLVLSGHLRFDYGFGDAENKSATSDGVDFYNSKRGATNNATGGGMLTLSYKLLKKEKETAKKKDADKKKSMSENDDNNLDNENDNETKTETPANNKNTTPSAITPIK